jgi:hypothetical protein
MWVSVVVVVVRIIGMWISDVAAVVLYIAVVFGIGMWVSVVVSVVLCCGMRNREVGRW